VTENEEEAKKGQDLYADLAEVTGIYIDNASDAIEMIDHLKILICKHLDKLLKDKKNEENSLGMGSS